MIRKKLHKFAVLTSLAFALLLPVKAQAAGYRLERQDTKMTCVNTETGAAVKSQFITHKGYTYYFDADGYAHTGWLKLGKDYYFFNADGSMVKKQWVNQYYFLANGKMARSRWVAGKVYVGSNGKVIPGYKKSVKAGFVNTKNGKKYRNPDGSYSQQTWQCIRGNWYYFYSTGVMAKNRQIGKFYVDKQGRMVVSKWVKIGNRKYYYGVDGRLKKTQKFQTKNTKK